MARMGIVKQQFSSKRQSLERIEMIKIKRQRISTTKEWTLQMAKEWNHFSLLRICIFLFNSMCIGASCT